MKQNNNLSVLPFYENVRMRQFNTLNEYGANFALVTSTFPNIPFQIRRTHRDNSVRVCNLVNYNTGSIINIMAVMRSYIRIVTDGEYDNIVFNGDAITTNKYPQGRYFLIVGDGVDTWSSEIFTIVENFDGYLKLEWRDTHNVEVGDQKIIYEGTNFKNILYLCAQIGMPEYEYTEEGENRDGRFLPLKQISEKVYRFNFVAPEYICDVLRLVPLADEVKVTDSQGIEYICDQILITPKWLEQGLLAEVQVELHTDTIAKTIGKGYGI